MYKVVKTLHPGEIRTHENNLTFIINGRKDFNRDGGLGVPIDGEPNWKRSLTFGSSYSFIPGKGRTRVARWFNFKPNILIWVNFEWPLIGKCLNMLWPNGIFYGHLGYFMTKIRNFLCSFGTFPPFWYIVSRKIWQTWARPLCLVVSICCAPSLERNFRCHWSRQSCKKSSEINLKIAAKVVKKNEGKVTISHYYSISHQESL
jgi:hypothetical protein